MAKQKITLPVSAVLRESYGFIIREYGRLASPLAILIGILLLQPLLIASRLQETKGMASSLVVFLGLAAVLADLAFSIGVSRAVIHGEYRPGWRFFLARRRLWQCLLIEMGVTIFSLALLVAIAIPLSIVIVTLFNLKHWLAAAELVSAIVMAYAWLRLRLILAVPLCALGYDHPIIKSWMITRGNVLRLALLSLLAWAPLAVISAVSMVPLATPFAWLDARAFEQWPYIVFAVSYALCEFIRYVLLAHCCRTLSIEPSLV